jgi:Ca2+-binding EF-hand superfamily protein
VSKEELVGMLREADADGDGKISQNDFISFMKKVCNRAFNRSTSKAKKD